MRPTYKQLLKLSLRGAARPAVGRGGYTKWFVKEVLLSPQAPRLVFLFFGAGAAAAYYSINSSGGKKDSKDAGHDILVERYNDRLTKYATSVHVAMNAHKESAQSVRKSMDLQRALSHGFNDMTREQLLLIQAVQKDRNRSMVAITAERDLANIKLRNRIVNATDTKDINSEEEKVISDIALKEAKVEISFWAKVLEICTPEQKKKLASTTTFIGTYQDRGVAPLLPQCFTVLTHYLSPAARPHVFVLKFDGDMAASQVVGLTEEITAIVMNAKPERGDKVVVLLNSGGGTVTGYGLAAAQLARLKKCNLELIVCVDQVAASGGYMMAAVADKIVAAPFSMLGSIGVVAGMPNFSERMNREGVDYEEVTAGKYKRTMTPFKPPTEETRGKVQSEIGEMMRLFKSFITVHRPKMDVELVATGEVWLGTDALKLGLCDSLATGEEVLLRLRNGEGATEDSKKDLPAEVYYLTYQKKVPFPPLIKKLFGGLDDASSGQYSGISLLNALHLLTQLLGVGSLSGGSNNGFPLLSSLGDIDDIGGAQQGPKYYM